MNWVLLRGLGRERRHWFEFPTHLKTRFPDHEILMLDLPGFGHEKNVSPPVTIAKNTEYIRAKFLEHVGAAHSQPWGLIGISLGGMVAMDWAHRHAEDFKSLVLINSSAGDLSAVHHRLSVYAMYRILRAGLAKNPREKERQILKMTSNLKAEDPSILNTMIEIANEGHRTPGKLARQLAAALRFHTPQEIRMPTLVLASLKDAMVDVRCSKALSERLHAPIKFHPNAGHELTLDDPEWVSERIQEFISTKI